VPEKSVHQGDRIGRIYGNWVIVYFGQLKITEVSNIFGLLYPRYNLYKNLYYICDFFCTNSSGHPGRIVPIGVGCNLTLVKVTEEAAI
jgi:hypothetical protein